MSADPIRQALRPTGLGIGIVGRTEHADENLGLADFTGLGIGDRHLLAGIVDKALVAGDNLLDWNIDYESPPDRLPEIDELLVASRGNTHAVRSFHVPRTDRYSVRVKDINRLDIPGSFHVVLYSCERAVARTHIFQPSSPRKCENCRKHGVFSTDFIVNSTDLDTNEEFRIAIEVKNRAGDMVEFPLADAGDPTVNIRLLLSTT